jgi:hypothetical protein
VCSVFVTGLFALIVPASEGLEPSGSIRRSPTEIVKNYVRLDMKGARLDSTSFDVLRPYIDWDKEQTWGSVVIIRDVDVPEDYRKWEIINNLDIIIPVSFQVRGSVQMDTAVFVPEETTEEVRFRVREVRNYWRIVDPMIPPHVGLKRMVNFVREAELHEKDASRRAVLAALGDSLRKAR